MKTFEWEGRLICPGKRVYANKGSIPSYSHRGVPSRPRLCCSLEFSAFLLRLPSGNMRCVRKNDDLRSGVMSRANFPVGLYGFSGLIGVRTGICNMPDC